eukprot:scaffold369_cov281-Pinguiococcus_pyrenoidosus.AAC.5
MVTSRFRPRERCLEVSADPSAEETTAAAWVNSVLDSASAGAPATSSASLSKKIQGRTSTIEWLRSVHAAENASCGPRTRGQKNPRGGAILRCAKATLLPTPRLTFVDWQSLAE